MAYIDDERRRRNRAGVYMTKEQEDWLARANIAQSKGLPVPPRPVEGEAGMQRLSPAYTDPRSQSIANSPIRPVRSMLDRIFSPGRADAVNQMNREYKENALTSQLGRSGQRIEQDYNKARTESLMTSNKMEELKRRALVDGDPKALKLLKAYTAAIGKGGGLDYGLITSGQGPDGTKIVRKDGASGGDGDTKPPENPYMNMSRDEAIDAYTHAVNTLNKDDLEAQAITEKSGEGLSRGGWKASDLYEAGIPMENLGITPGMKQRAEQRLERNKQVKNALTKQISAAHNWSPTNAGGPPLTSPSGGPTHYINQ